MAAGIGAPATASAHWVQAPCDFVTAGGFVFKDHGERANFGAHGGCKNNEFWGHVNYVDHQNQFHLNSTRITGYNGEPGRNDTFGITIDNWNSKGDRFYRVSSRKLANGGPGGGNVQLHKGNNSNTIDPKYLQLQEWQMCGDMAYP